MAADRPLIYAAALLRGLAAGAISVLAAVWLAKRGFDEAAIGAVLSAGMAGVLAGTVYGTYVADRVGRRLSLVLLAALAAFGALLMLWADALWAVLAASFVGMLNTQGSDRGAAQALEQAILPATASDAERTRVFAGYNALADLGGAAGALLAGLPAVLESTLQWPALRGYDATVGLYALLLVAVALLYARLSPAAERGVEDGDASAGGAHDAAALDGATANAARNATPAAPPAATHDPQLRPRVRRFAALSALDAVGGGFIGSAIIAYYLYARFGIGAGELALLFVAARLMTVASHFVAAWLAQRIGLVNTMVFTHIPSSLLLLTLPIAPSFAVAALLFILREGLSEMDVPTRQSYLMAIVPPRERAWAAGLAQLARAAGRMVSPLLAGVAMQAGELWLPLAAGAAIKIAYDLLLWRAFRAVKPPEERAAAAA